MSGFAQPPVGGDQLDLNANNGKLLIVWALELVEKIPTTFGENDAVRANVVILDDPAGPQELSDVLFFPRKLVGSLRKAIGGDPVLGRLGQGVAKQGQSAPWQLNPYSEQDGAVATAYLASRPVPFQQAGAAPAEAVPATVPPVAAVAPAAAPPAASADAPAAQGDALTQAEIVKLAQNGINVASLDVASARMVLATLP